MQNNKQKNTVHPYFAMRILADGGLLPMLDQAGMSDMSSQDLSMIPQAGNLVNSGIDALDPEGSNLGNTAQAAIKAGTGISSLALNPAVLGATSGFSALAIPLAAGAAGTAQFIKEKKIDEENYKEGLSNFMAYGGDLKMMNFGGEIDSIEGPSHAQGGIQMGPNSEVEGGEARAGDYIFSDQLEHPDFPGKTFADVAKSYKKKYEERQGDPYSMATQERQLSDLMKANEATKKLQQEMEAQTQKALEEDALAYGGYITKDEYGKFNVAEDKLADMRTKAKSMKMPYSDYISKVHEYACGGKMKYAEGGPLDGVDPRNPFVPNLDRSNLPLEAQFLDTRVLNLPDNFMGTPKTTEPSITSEMYIDDYNKNIWNSGIGDWRQVNDPIFKFLKNREGTRETNPLGSEYQFGTGSRQETPEEAANKAALDKVNTFRDNIATNDRMTELGDLAFQYTPEEAADIKRRLDAGEITLNPDGSINDNPGYVDLGNLTPTGEPSDMSTIFDALGTKEPGTNKDVSNKIGNEELALFASSVPAISTYLKGLNPEETKFDRFEPEIVDLSLQREQIARDAATARDTQNANVRGNAKSSGEALSALSTGNTALTKNRMAMDSESYLNESLQNVNLKNQANQMNTQIANEEIIANEQNRALAESAKSAAVASEANNVQGYLKDKKMTAVEVAKNEKMLEVINAIAPDYKWGTDPSMDDALTIIYKNKTKK